MKLTAVILFAAFLQVSARGYSQITLSETNAPLQKVFQEIRQQSGYDFVSTYETLKKAGNVTVNVRDVSLQKALDECLKDKPLTYVIIGKTVVVQLKATDYYNASNTTIALEPISPPPIEIHGRVINQKGEPLGNASVLISGTKIGTATDKDGRFSLTAPENKNIVLEISSVGYQTKKVKTDGQTEINVTLELQVTGLNDVVVVGYGKSTRQNLSSSITSVKPDQLNKGAIGDLGQLLQGKVAGLNISASGDPNVPAAVILRGASTINSPGAPFYVIDGVPGADISLIAPDDIASIDVLKDAAATAIYGNRASSGVIIITTQKGKKGDLQTNYNGYVGFEKVTSNLKYMDANQLKSYLKANGAALSPNDDFGANTNWSHEIEKSVAVSFNHNISFSGGGEHNNYSASLNYLDKDGILLKSSLKRFIARLSYEQYALNNKVKFGLSVSNSRSDESDISLGVLHDAAHYYPTAPVKNPDGTYFENFNIAGNANPVAMLENENIGTKHNNLIGIFTTEVTLPFGLTYNTHLSYQQLNSLHGEFYSSYYSNYPALLGNLYGPNGSALRNYYQNSTQTIESFLTWNRKFGDHSFNAVIGYSWQNNIYGDGFQTSSANFPADNIGYNNLALGNPYALPSYRVQYGPDGVYGQTRLISDFGRLNYDYKGKYLLQGSIRRDGGSVFGTNNQWGYFPSVGIAWRISQEGFMQKQSFINDLKLRGSYGVTGNSQGFGAYTAQFLYGITGTYYSNGIQLGAYGPIQGANPDLKWERTSTTNIGADFSILKGKINGSIDWYDKNTTGMIFNYTVSSAIVPGGKIWANGGSMSNKGIELTLAATTLKKGNFRWNTSLNLAHNNNLITSLTNPYGNGDSILYTAPGGPGQSGSTIQILKVGKPLGQFFSLRYAGKDQNGNSQFLRHDGTLTTAPVIGVDYWYVGNAQPKLLAGWSNTFSYKNFDLNIFIRGVWGNKIFDATRADMFYVAGAASENNIAVDAANDKITDAKNSTYSTRFIENGSYVRLDNATLAYNFNNLGNYIHSVRIYATANNLFVLTKYKGIDPEITQGGISPGYDYHNFYPKTRTILFGVNVSF